MSKTPPKIRFSPDFENSTYLHVIYFDPTNPANSRELIHGFSKSDRHPESHDKEYVLMRMCKKIYWSKKYLPTGKILRIEVYQKPDIRYTWGQSHLILTLFPDNYVIESHELLSSVRVASFLQQLYRRLALGQSIDDLEVMSQIQGKSYEKILNDLITYRKFKTEQELKDFVINWIGKGHNVEQTLDFMHRYTEKHFITMLPQVEKMIKYLRDKFGNDNSQPNT
jgi:hypothetical protein